MEDVQVMLGIRSTSKRRFRFWKYQFEKQQIGSISDDAFLNELLNQSGAPAIERVIEIEEKEVVQ